MHAYTVKPLIMDSLKGGQPLYMDKFHAPDCSSYRNSTVRTSEKRTPLYSGQWTASVPPKDCNLYKMNTKVLNPLCLMHVCGKINAFRAMLKKPLWLGNKTGYTCTGQPSSIVCFL